MTEPKAEELLEYMATHILASTGVRVDASWNADEVLKVFRILPRPRVSFNVWRGLNGAKAAESEEAVAEENSKADAALASAFNLDEEDEKPNAESRSQNPEVKPLP